METTSLKLGNKNVIILAAAIVLLAAFMLFGFAGVRALLAIFLFLFLPAYLFFDLFDFLPEEKVFFAAATGLALFPLAVWFVSRVIPSFRVSAVVTLVLAVSLALFFKFRKKSKNNAQGRQGSGLDSKADS